MSRFEKIDPINFGNLIEVYKKFTIPKFQRPYSWEKQNLKDFFSSIVENDIPYFIGYLICLPAESTESGRLSIVDGQQRITTISLTYAALIDTYKKYKTKQKIAR